ncbi:MAG: peptidoglycan DD-metalloendopeptidase family protein [Cytophagales bacterium]|nr:peptidoglycan DD-metalloendopeptidase family protein [Bernardetiaceae bacterium]MDW8204514.1 peptidoglycan DD-metalloendopeptidase family protein [Cytophagales bacterium]
MRILLLTLLISLVVQQHNQAQIKRKVDSLELVRLQNFKKIEELQQTILSTGNSKQLTLTEYEARRVLLKRYQEDIKIIREQLYWIQQQIEETKQIIESLQQDEIRLREEYKKIVYELSKVENQVKNSVVSIISVESWNELNRRRTDYEQAERERREKIAAIQATVRKLTERQKQLSYLEESRAATELSLKSNIDFEEQQRRILEQRLKQLQKQETVFLEQKEKLERFNEYIVKEINQIYSANPPAAKPETPPTLPSQKSDVASANRTEASANEPKTKITPAGAIRSENFAEHKSLLPWPVNRFNFIYPFGIRSYPGMPHIEYENLGIEISTPKNEPVRSIFEGQVVNVLREDDLGWIVIAKYDDYLCIYARLQNVTVKKGARIKAGTLLGTVGTNQDGYPMLQFQIWKQRQNLNPEDWLAKNY